jgi:hypothetical protein
MKGGTPAIASPAAAHHLDHVAMSDVGRAARTGSASASPSPALARITTTHEDNSRQALNPEVSAAFHHRDATRQRRGSAITTTTSDR